jgi:AraC family transcriptional regulator, transcriptional activator of pobA
MQHKGYAMMNKQIAPVIDIKGICELSPFRDFKISRLDDLSCTASEFGEPHRHHYYTIFWISSGSGIHHIDLEQYHYSGPVAFILSPGQIHRIEQTTPADGYIIKFLPSLFKDERDFLDYVIDTCLFDCVTMQPKIAFNETIQMRVESTIEQLVIEYEAPNPDSANLISSYLKILITYINRAKNRNISSLISIGSPQFLLFRSFRIELQKHFRQQHSVQFYAELLNTTARTLNDACRKLGGRSVSDIIQDQILLEAKRCLLHHKQSIKEICFSLGFDDPSYFTRFFKKHIGLSPQQFKEEQLFKSSSATA